MAGFPKLKRALFTWVNDAMNHLSRDSGARDYTTDLGHWQRDSDGVFRDIERPVELWNHIAVNNLFDLPSWTTVLDVLHADNRLSDQIDTFVGTAQGGHRIEATSIGRRVLPRPNELDQVIDAFEVRYEELESFLAADEIEYTVVWPLPGLTSDVLPVQLDAKLELDAMSDRELGFALDTEIVRTPFPRDRLLNPRPEHRTCMRYRYGLPKLVGDTDLDETHRAFQEIEDELRHIESALKESLAIVLPDAGGVAGRFSVISQQGSPLAGGIAFQEATLPQGPRLRRAHMNEEQAAELLEVWSRQIALESVYKEDPDRIRRLITDDKSAHDVVAVAHRRESLEKFRRLLSDSDFFDEQIPQGQGPESVWQKFLEDNRWILGGSLAGQFLTSWNENRLEQVVVGSSIAGVGKRTDALLRTAGLVHSMVFVEIKHHRTKLLAEEYRPGCWSPSKELSGGVAQVQGTVQRSIADIGSRLSEQALDGSEIPGAFTYLFRPRSFLIIGSLNELTGEMGGINLNKYQSFELYRRHLQEPNIITFDELLARAEGLLEVADV